MDEIIMFLGVIATLILLIILLNFRRITIFQFERGILYRRGKFIKILEPGSHWYYRPIHTIQKTDVRSQILPIPGQEVLSADNVGIKISLAGHFRIEDPYLAAVEVIDCHQAIYLELQVNLRDVIGEIPIEEFLSKRKEIGDQIFERSKEKLSQYGIALEGVSIKDMMFPGDLKRIFAQEVRARKEGLAALERARGESAALRNLANSASVLQKNPGLLQIRILHAIENSLGNTFFLGDLSEKETLAKLISKDKNQE